MMFDKETRVMYYSRAKLRAICADSPQFPLDEDLVYRKLLYRYAIAKSYHLLYHSKLAN